MSRLAARDLCAAPPADGTRAQRAPDGAVVRGFCIEAGPGEWVALGGPNGCGKTTLLLTLAGLWPAVRGEVLLDGRPLGPGRGAGARSRVAVVMQDPSSQLVQPTVRDELGFAALNLGVAPDEVARRVSRWSGRLGLAGDSERDPQELSAGRQQLVLLAAALVAEPDLLLADEPICHLDAATRALVLEVVREEASRGLAVIWVTQDETERSAADRAIELGRDDREALEPWRGVVPGPSGRMVRLVVSPWNGSEGPSVRTSVALDLPLGRTGIVAVEGPNGVGKSVLLSAAARVLQLEQVQVVWEAGEWPPPLVSCQYPELEIFEENAGDEMAHAAVSRGLPRQEALARASVALDRLGADGESLAGRATWSLSGGEKRLVSLAGALIAPASLLALDEPTAGLDGRKRASLAALLGEVAQERSVLVASQDEEWLGALPARRYGLGGTTAGPAASQSEKTD